MSTSKYSALTRSQILIALNHAETKLLLWKHSDPRRAAVESDRAQLFLALRAKDEEIVRRWESAHPCILDKRKMKS